MRRTPLSEHVDIGFSLIENEPGEEWRKLPYWPYLVSNHGRVYGLNSEKIVKSKRNNRSWYLGVTLNQFGHHRHAMVHDLVMVTFGPLKPSSKHEINHKDCNKGNSHIDNLEWVTRQENIVHGHLHRLGGTALIEARDLIEGAVKIEFPKSIPAETWNTKIAEKYHLPLFLFFCLDVRRSHIRMYSRGQNHTEMSYHKMDR